MAPVVAGVALRVRDERIHAEGTCTHEDATGRLPLGIALDARVADRRAIDALARAFLARFDGAATGRAYDGQAGTGERAVIPSPVAIARSLALLFERERGRAYTWRHLIGESRR